MSKRGYISRYLLILKKLKRDQYISFEELQRYLERQFEFLQENDDTLITTISKRTLQRDFRDIKTLFGVEVEYSRSYKGYHISSDESKDEKLQRTMEAIDMLNSINLSEGLSPYLIYEKRRASGTDNIYGLIHAIKQRAQVSFTYRTYGDDEISERTVEPYVLKEFKYRWFLLARDNKDGIVKSFALDKLSSLLITSRHIAHQEAYDVLESHKYSFGIMSPNDEQPTEIILSFKPLQGRYVKSLPLHESQETLVDNKNELRVKLKLFMTDDFIVELVSYGESMKVIQPAKLAKRIKKIHLDALNLYN